MEQTEGKVNAYACVFVCVCVLEGRAEEGTRRRQFRDGTRVGRETLAGMGGPAGGLQGFEGSLEGGAGNKKGMWSRGGMIGVRDGVALGIGSRGGMGAGIKMERGRGRGRGAELGLETVRETWED